MELKVLLHDLSEEELKVCAGHLLTDDMVALTRMDKMPKMHHELRYNNHPQITVYFYSDDMTLAEQKVAKERVRAMGINFGSSKEMVTFLSSASELKEVRSW